MSKLYSDPIVYAHMCNNKGEQVPPVFNIKNTYMMNKEQIDYFDNKVKVDDYIDADGLVKATNKISYGAM